jgi:hypothetical protein
MEDHYTVEDFMKYVTGWLGADSVNTNLSISEMKAALLNATSMLEDSQDGIESFVEHRDYIDTEIDWSME